MAERNYVRRFESSKVVSKNSPPMSIDEANKVFENIKYSNNISSVQDFKDLRRKSQQLDISESVVEELLAILIIKNKKYDELFHKIHVVDDIHNMVTTLLNRNSPITEQPTFIHDDNNKIQQELDDALKKIEYYEKQELEKDKLIIENKRLKEELVEKLNIIEKKDGELNEKILKINLLTLNQGKLKPQQQSPSSSITTMATPLQLTKVVMPIQPKFTVYVTEQSFLPEINDCFKSCLKDCDVETLTNEMTLSEFNKNSVILYAKHVSGSRTDSDANMIKIKEMVDQYQLSRDSRFNNKYPIIYTTFLLGNGTYLGSNGISYDLCDSILIRYFTLYDDRGFSRHINKVQIQSIQSLIDNSNKVIN